MLLQINHILGQVNTLHSPADGAAQCDEARYGIGWDAPRYPLPVLTIPACMTLTDMLWVYYDAPLEWWIASKPHVSALKG